VVTRLLHHECLPCPCKFKGLRKLIYMSRGVVRDLQVQGLSVQFSI
jgi:hypothetical protein